MTDPGSQLTDPDLLAMPPGAPKLTIIQRVRLGAEILRAYVAVRRLSGARRLPAVMEALRATPAVDGAPLPDPHVDGRRLGSAVTRTLVVVPGGTRCLMRSLVLVRLLARRDARGEELIIAVQPGPDVLDAHAWIELDGRPLLPPGGDHERIVVL
jgi:hypothetical protein